VSETKDLNDALQATGGLDLDAITVPVDTPPAPEGEAEAAPGFERIGAFLDDALERMRKRADGEERPAATPWPTLDAQLNGGLWPGLVVLVGNSGTGKSQLALQLSLQLARNGAPALYVGLELDRLGIAARLAAMSYRLQKPEESPVAQWSELYTGRARDIFTPKLPEVFTSARQHLAGLPFYFEQGPPDGWAISELAPRVGQLRKMHPKGPLLVVLDFLQIIGQEPGERAELRERIRKAAYVGRAVARDYDAIVLLVSSTSREHYGKLSGKEKGKDIVGWPHSLSFDELLGTGKESGEIEYAADVALVMCQKKRGEPVYIAIAKQRAGVPSWVALDFDGCMFTNDRQMKAAGREETSATDGSGGWDDCD
jgi:KaiC/GvpD/RAD55 family RecA-like ATPase